MKKVNLNIMEQNKYEIIKKLVETNGNKHRAAIALSCSLRHINRLIQIYKTKGKYGFLHGNTGRSPSIAKGEYFKQNIIQLYKNKYFDTNFAHFRDLLEINEGISVSYSLIYTTLTSIGILSPKPYKTTVAKWRKRIKDKEKPNVD